MNHPRMTSAGRRFAALFGVAIAMALPKHVECGYPDATCGRPGPFHQTCTAYEMEPLGIYAIEYLLHRDVGFAYASGENCR